MSELAVYDPNKLPIRQSVTAGKLIDADVWTVLANVASTVAHTEFVPAGLRGKPESVLACLLYGHDLGLGPMVALREIAMIDGKPSLSAALVTARIRQAGHRMEWKELRDNDGEFVGTTAYGQRADGSKGEYTFTLKMAQRAGLIRQNGPWIKYPESMCWARAATQLARMLFSDVFLGHATYMPEELGGEPDEDSLSGLVIDDQPSLSSGEPEAQAASPDPTGPNPSPPVEPPAEPAPGGGASPFQAPDPNKPCAQFTDGRSTQRKTLNLLNLIVVEGRKAGQFTTADVYEWARDIDPLNVKPDAFYIGDDGKLHWSDLRSQAPLWLCSQLIDRIKLEHGEWYGRFDQTRDAA